MNDALQRRRLTASEVLQRYKDEELPAFYCVASVDVNQRGMFGEHPLEVAVCRGRTEEIRALLEGGAFIDAAGELGNTALHEAVGQGDIAAVEILLEFGARRDLRNDFGQTALEIAKLTNRHELVSLLQGRGTSE